MCTHMYVRARDCVCVGTGGRVLCVRARAVACRMRGERTRATREHAEREGSERERCTGACRVVRGVNATAAREHAE